MLDERSIKKLAELARIAVSPEEETALAKDLEKIVGYVSSIAAAPLSKGGEEGGYLDLHNVFREDGEAHPTGAYTEKLLAGAPAALRGYLKVKKIIAQD